MKKLGLIIILLLFSALTYSQNNAVYKRVSLDTLKARTGTKKVYVKDTVIINNILRIPAGATDGNIAYSNANGDVIWGTLPSEADSLFVTYCCGCVMNDGWKALEDTIKIDTCYVNQIIKDSLSNHLVLINKLDTGKVSTSGDNMYGTLNIKNGNFVVKGTVDIGNVPLGTDIDSVLIMENGQLKNVDGSSFKPDSTSTGCFNNFYYKQITGCDNNNLYIKANTTSFSNDIKLPKFTNNNTKPILGLVSTGRIDTIPVVNITDDYVLNSGDNLNGIYDIQTGGLIITPLANATGDKVVIIHESGVIDTAKTITLETASINYITLVDSLTINGVTTYQYGGNILNDGLILFPANSFGHGTAYVYNAGMYIEYAEFILNIDGTYILQRNSGNVVDSNADGNVCLYTNMIQNRLGGTRYFIITLYKN